MKEILITSSVLIAVLLVLRWVFAKKVRRTLIYAAWALVALRLLIPVQIGQLDFSVLTAAKPLTETVTEVSGLRVIGQNEREAETQVILDYIERDQTAFNPETQIFIQESLERDESKEEIATQISKTQSPENTFVPEVQQQVTQQVEEQTNFVSIGQVATVIWLVGVAGMTVWFAIINLRHGRMLRQNRAVLECESPIPVYVSETVGSPCLVGLFRPAVYLTPESAADEITRRHVLTHELTHFAHKDHIWSLARCVCLCVYWFDPLVWAAAWFSRRDCELACDEGALKRLGETERLAYGKSLLDVVSHASAPSHLIQTATAMNETKAQLKERVNFIVKKPKWSIIAAICMVLVCAIVAGCATAGPTTGTQNGEGTSSTAPTEPTQPTAPEKKVNIYVVTEQKNYTKNELESTATFQYDDRGRPTAVGFEMADGSGRKTELAYDEAGNLVWYQNTQAYVSGEDSVQELTWNLTYTDGLLTRVERPYGDGSSYVLNLSYNDAGQLVLVEYPRPEKGVGGDLWQNYVYDENGRLTSETRCTYQHAGGDKFENVFSQVRYFYDEDGRLTEQCFCSARSDMLDSPEDLDKLDFQVSPLEHYFFYYDQSGNLAYVGDGADDTYSGGSATIYSDEDYTFDEHGNLVRVRRNDHSWVEYTYEAIEINESDVVMHKRLIHGISHFTLSYTKYNTMDPLFWEMCPPALYHYHLCTMSFYYLIPYPQFELFCGNTAGHAVVQPQDPADLLAMIPEETQRRIMDEYLTRFDSRYADDPELLDRAFMEVYGVFGDTYALFVYVAGDAYSTAVSFGALHGYKFTYPTLEETMYIYHDGRFYHLMEIIDEQIITKEQAYVVYTNYTNRNNFLKPTVPVVPTDTDLTAEMAQLLDEALYTQKGQHAYWKSGAHYYGRFGECVVFFTPDIWGGKSVGSVGGYTFTSEPAVNIWVYKDGVVEYLSYAYQNHMISDLELEALHRVHSAYVPSQFNTYTVSEESLQPYLTPLSKDTLAGINKIWSEKDNHQYRWDGVSGYYGIYGDCVVVIEMSPICDPMELQVADYRFACTGAFNIYVFTADDRIPLQQAYEIGLLTYEQLVFIYTCHVLNNPLVYG